MKTKRNHLVVKAWVFFTFNYYDPNEIIDKICEKTGNHIETHLKNKFSEIYDRCGSKAAMNVFYCEINQDLRNALVDYAVEVYAPDGLLLSEEERDLIGA